MSQGAEEILIKLSLLVIYMIEDSLIYIIKITSYLITIYYSDIYYKCNSEI